MSYRMPSFPSGAGVQPRLSLADLDSLEEMFSTRGSSAKVRVRSSLGGRIDAEIDVFTELGVERWEVRRVQ